MDIEQSEDINNDQLDFEPLTLKTDKKLALSNEAETLASCIASHRTKNVEHNRGLDTNNNAIKCSFALKTKEFGTFKHFFTKNKYRDDRIDVLSHLRQLAQDRDIELNGRIKDKLEKSCMILRVISKEEANGYVIVEDETGKEKMQVRKGTVYVGMIACMQVTWADGCYRLQQVFDITRKVDNLSQKCFLREPTQAYRILFLKGSFSLKDSKEPVGVKILTNEVRLLREREKEKVDCIVIFGPILNCKNTALTQGFSDLTYEEQASETMKLIKDEISKISEEIQVVFVPSTEDITNLYPIPQPRYNRSMQVEGKKLHYASNPGIIYLNGARQVYQVNVINSDLNQYMNENRVGQPNNMLQENLDAYFRQPFYMTNAHEEPFDETNLPGLYNAGDFGHIVVSSSRKDAPFAREIRGRLFVNIGSLGIDQPNPNDHHYMTLVSIYDGEGPVTQRVKVESLKM